MAEINSLFFKRCEKTVNSCFSAEEKIPHSESIAWFSKMARKENVSLIDVNNALKKIEKFIDKKELEKEEIIAEIQLIYGFQELLEEKRYELSESQKLKNRR